MARDGLQLSDRNQVDITLFGAEGDGLADWVRAGGLDGTDQAQEAMETYQSAVLDDERMLDARIKKIPARRMGQPDELGPMVCYLVSPLSDYVTGACFVIDGGEVAKL